MASIIVSPQAIANAPNNPSPTDRTPMLQQPHSATTGDAPNPRTNSPNNQMQQSQYPSSDAEPKRDIDVLNESHPAYCEPYLSNAEPGSWQFKQDIQRCLYGQ